MINIRNIPRIIWLQIGLSAIATILTVWAGFRIPPLVEQERTLRAEVGKQQIALESLHAAEDVESKNLQSLKDDLAKCVTPTSEKPNLVQVTPVFPATVIGKTFDDVIWLEPQLQNKRIKDTTFYRARLSRPRFFSSNLENVSFKGAELTSGDFRNTTLKLVDFSGANLSGVDFFRASMEDVTWSENTICPDGVKSNKEGCTKHFVRYPWSK